ncbi:sigma-70 family RNA polymerase sigma factor [candidate division KSB1 bacterium]|nr:sigma-70 family RNA polymerase sigma factor [candidate division KSB1 bacterium]
MRRIPLANSSKYYSIKNPEDSLDRYLREINEIPLLEPREEIELAKKIRAGDHEALEKLTKANLRFVVSVAKQYQNQGLSLGDLINEGNLGLIKAAGRFDESRGFKFISYAVWWIRQSILQALAEQSRIVRIPLNRIGTLNKIERLFATLEQEYEREPAPFEIAEAMDMSSAEISNLLASTSKQLSLNAAIDEEEENKLIDIIENPEMPPPDSQLQFESLRQEIEHALSSLDIREAEVIKLYFGIALEHPLTLEEIGLKFDLTRERVRQIKEKALRRLRHNSRSNLLRKYLG